MIRMIRRCALLGVLVVTALASTGVAAHAAPAGGVHAVSSNATDAGLCAGVEILNLGICI